MSDSQKGALRYWLDVVFKLAVPLGLAALFFLRSSFATRPELEGLNARISGIEKVLAVMAEQNRTNERQDKRLEDHEGRIRSLEFVTASNRRP